MAKCTCCRLTNSVVCDLCFTELEVLHISVCIVSIKFLQITCLSKCTWCHAAVKGEMSRELFPFLESRGGLNNEYSPRPFPRSRSQYAFFGEKLDCGVYVYLGLGMMSTSGH